MRSLFLRSGCLLAVSLLLVPFSCSLVLAGDDLAVLKADAGKGEPGKMLYRYLLGQAQRHFDLRRKSVAELKTSADLMRRQQAMKHSFLEALGGFPPRTPLNARVVGSLQREGYRVERVIYESRPQHHVTALLYLPDGRSPFPGVLVPCGHSANGKAIDSYQRVCILLAKNGLAALCYDPIGQGERIQLLTPEGKPAIAGSTSEHTMVGIGALLIGGSTATYRIWDGIRSLDYLISRPEIDPQRIGCTGNSGGGTLTAYLMALDERIVAAAPSCYITSLERLFVTIGPQDAEQNITGQVAMGLEHADYVTMRAPKPTLICVASRDFFDIQGAWTTFREAKLLYGLLDRAECVDLFEFNDGHGFSKPRRQAAMRWMRRWLLNKEDSPVEKDLPISSDRELQCTRTGQVLADFKSKSAFDLNAAREIELASGRDHFKSTHSRQEMLKEIRRLIGLSRLPGPAQVCRRQSVQKNGMMITPLVFETEPGIELPGLAFKVKAGTEKCPLMLYLHGNGKSVEAGPAIDKLVRAGNEVLALDLRGMGELSPSPPSAGSRYFGTDEKEAFLALHLNRPLLGQRVFDVLAVIDRLVADGQSDLSVSAVGSAGPIALHAAALDNRIKQVSVERSLISWSQVVHTPISLNQLTNVVPGALKIYDLPELAVAIAPRRLTFVSPVDAVNRPVPPIEMHKAYAAAKTAYRSQNADSALKLSTGP